MKFQFVKKYYALLALLKAFNKLKSFLIVPGISQYCEDFHVMTPLELVKISLGILSDLVLVLHARLDNTLVPHMTCFPR